MSGITKKVYVEVPWYLKEMAESLGGEWNRDVKETEFDATTDLSELHDAIEIYYARNPRVRKGAGRPVAGAGFTLVEVPYMAPGAEEARAFIKARGGEWDKPTKKWLVPDAEVERVKGMIELPAINWGRS